MTMTRHTQAVRQTPFRDMFITCIAMMYIAARMLGIAR